MSFGKAKRFIYKPTEEVPSPADYSVSSRFSNGFKFPKSSRFSYSSDGESEAFTMCPRMFHSEDLRSSTPNSQGNYSDTSAIKLLKSKIAKFNRDDIKRQSIRKKSSDRNTTTEPCMTKSNSNSGEIFWNDGGDYIDDDYYSITSSEELDKLKETEKYTLEEVCKELRRIQERNSVRNHEKRKNFEEIVLEKLRNIENNIKHLKDDVAKVHKKQKQIIDIEIIANNYGKQKPLPLDEIKRTMLGTITNTFKDLEKYVEEERRTKLEEVQDTISSQLKEISAASQKSVVKEICKTAAEQLTEGINTLLENKVASQNLSRAEGTEEVASGEALNSENVILSGKLQESLEYVDILEQDELDITLKYANSQQLLLETQGRIIDSIKDKLADLKLNL